MSARLYNGKWDGIWDKPKYQRIRQKIWDAFEGIEFIEESHRYFYKGQELIPTSNVCHLFRQPFDEDLMAQQCENKYFNLEGHKYYGMTKDEIIESWHQNSKRATTHGTSIHLFGENCAYFMMRQYDRLTEDFKARIIRENDGREYVESVEPKEEAIVNFWNDLPVSIIPIVFEIQMYSLKYGISGTADLLFLHDPHIELEDNDEEISQRLYLMDYKGLPLDTPILTTNGWKTMGTINEGDIVYDKDGKQTEVLHTSEIHHNPCYKITFDNGDNIVADHQHKWLINDGYVLTTEQLNNNYYIEKLNNINNSNKTLLHIVSVEKVDTVPTRCIEVNSPSHTYLCGKNLLVTHNTNADLYKAFDHMKEPFEEMLDNDLSGYKLQAAIYSYFLESHGFKFVSRALIWLRDLGDNRGGYEKVKMESLVEPLFKYLDTHPLKTLMHKHHY
jgi:hypothetical protein